MNELKIVLEITPAPTDEDVVWRGLRHHNEQDVVGAGDTTYGGVLAKTGRGWLHVNTLWVAPNVRDQGYGTQLMAAAEAEARHRGCHSA